MASYGTVRITEKRLLQCICPGGVSSPRLWAHQPGDNLQFRCSEEEETLPRHCPEAGSPLPTTKAAHTAHTVSFVDFLDVVIFRHSDGFVQTDMFPKKTLVNSLLHASSSHPAPTKDGIPVGQLLRACRICSSDDLFQKQAEDLMVRFHDRGYKNHTVREGYMTAANRNEKIYWFQKRKSWLKKSKWNLSPYLMADGRKWGV